MTGRTRPRLGVAISPAEVPPVGRSLSRVGVIDVLRATTVIPHALAAGAARILPVATVEEARRLAVGLPGEEVLLCGEREGIRLPGFDLGNSPAEYTGERVGGRTLLYCSSNGSGTVVRWGGAPELLLLSFVNVGAAVDRLARGEGDTHLVCAGQGGRACLEDTALAGLAVRLLRQRRPDLVPDDGAEMAERVWESWEEDVGGLLLASSHGRYLKELGFAADLVVCGQRDALTLVPILTGEGFGDGGS